MNNCKRNFSIFSEFSKQVKGTAQSNDEFRRSIKLLKDKAEELKQGKDNIKLRTKKTAEKLCKNVDVVLSKLEAAKNKVKQSYVIRKQELWGSSYVSQIFSVNKENSHKGEGMHNGSLSYAQILFGRIRSAIPFTIPKTFIAFKSIEKAKVVELSKKYVDIVKDELKGNESKKSRMQHSVPSPSTCEKNIRDISIVPSKQAWWGKKWGQLMEMMGQHPLFQRISGISDPIVTKSQEIAEDMRERWETSDSPVVHKIQDLNESVFGETHSAVSLKEIWRRDPSFSLSDFVSEVQEFVKPVLNAYIKCDVEKLKKYCTHEVVERCKAEHQAFESQGMFFDNKILHVSEVEMRETKMMGSTPIIILAFQTQQVYCMRDGRGFVKDGGKDAIHTVYYAWAMQQSNDHNGGIYPVWRLREMQQLGVRALI